MRKSLAERCQETILRQMNRQGVTQRDLAAELGITESRVSQMLSAANLTLRSVERIDQALRTLAERKGRP